MLVPWLDGDAEGHEGFSSSAILSSSSSSSSKPLPLPSSRQEPLGCLLEDTLLLLASSDLRIKIVRTPNAAAAAAAAAAAEDGGDNGGEEETAAAGDRTTRGNSSSKGAASRSRGSAAQRAAEGKVEGLVAAMLKRVLQAEVSHCLLLMSLFVSF